MKIHNILAPCIVIALLLSGCGKKQEEQPQPTDTPTPAQTEYSGTLTPISTSEVYADMTGEIKECDINIGDSVTAGQTLYIFDDNGLYNNIKTAEDSVKKAQITVSSAEENEKNLSIYAPASGILKDFDITKGERVNTQTIGQIADETKFVARIPFSEQQLKSISVGSNASITCTELMAAIPAKVSRIYSEKNTSVSGAVLYDVEFTGANPGGLKEGASVTAIVNGIESPSGGYIDKYKETALVSRASGNASAVYAREGDYVKAGALLIKVDNSNVSSTLQRSRIDKRDYEIKLQALHDDEKKLTICSPATGVVIKKEKSARDNVSSKTDTLMTIADISKLTLTITLPKDIVSKYSQDEYISISGEFGTIEGIITSISDSGDIIITIDNICNIKPYSVGTISIKESD